MFDGDMNWAANKVYELSLKAAKEEMRQLIRAAVKQIPDFKAGEDDQAIGEIALICVWLTMKGIPSFIALGMALRAHSQKVDAS